MTKTRWIAAVLAAIVVIPYCMRMERMRAAPAAPTAAAPTAASPRALGVRVGATPFVTARATTPSRTRSTAPMAAPATAALPAGAGGPVAVATPATSAADPAAGGLTPVSSDAWAAGKFADFSREELEEMAQRCELRWQMPRAPSDRYQAAVRALYVELTGDDAERSPRIMDDTLRVESDERAIDAHKRLAERRAGDADVAASGSVYERYLQLQLDEAERARRDGDALGPKYTMTGCDPDHALFRSGR